MKQEYSTAQTVVITGANRGIGLSLTALHADRGNTVYALCRKASGALQALAQKTQALHIIENIDVATDSSIARVKQSLGSIEVDLLVNNAGILQNEQLDALDFESIQQQLQVNTLGPLRMVQALLEQFSAQAKIAMMTSRMGSISDNSSGGRYGYRLSKAALNAASVSLAHDLKPRGIAVAILHPGLVGTDMIGGVGNVTPDQAADQLQQRIDALTLSQSGRFWHANGEQLPW